MLAEPFDVVATLHLVQPDDIAKVCSGDNVAVFVEIDAPGVAPAFSEEFELFRQRVISPDPLLEFDAANVGGDRASLRTVQPAVRAPLK